MKEQIRNLTMNLKLNKQLLAMTEENATQGGEANLGSATAATEAKLKAYQEREEVTQKQMEETLKQRDQGQAQILIFE